MPPTTRNGMLGPIRALNTALIWSALVFTLAGAPTVATAQELQPNEPEPKVVPESNHPADAASDTPDNRDDPAADLKRHEQCEAMLASQQCDSLPLTLFAAADFSLLNGNNASQSGHFNGAPLAWHRAHTLATTDTRFRVAFFEAPPVDAAPPDQRSATVFFGEDLRTTWRTADGGHHDMGWQSLGLTLTPLADAGINRWIPVAGQAQALALGLAIDHLALHESSATGVTSLGRYRDGVRLTCDLFRLDGLLWNADGPALGILLDCSTGLGVMSERAYVTVAANFEPYIGYSFYRPDPLGANGKELPFGGIYLGLRSGTRLLTTFGHNPTQFTAVWGVEPTLSVRLFF